MKILFVRHAEAVEAAHFEGPDLLRPLTREGKKDAAAAYRRLFDLFPKPELILASEATRAQETADLIHARARKAKRAITPDLNPGSGVAGFRRALKACAPESVNHLVVVGHEPDISQTVSALCAGGQLSIRIKKGACVEVELASRRRLRGTLRSAISPAALRRAR